MKMNVSSGKLRIMLIIIVQLLAYVIFLILSQSTIFLNKKNLL